MSAAANDALVRRWMAIWDSGAVAALDDLYAPDFVYHMRFPAQQPGLAGEKQILGMLHAAFPDLRMVTEDVVANETSAAVRWTMPGSHQRAFLGVPASGKPVTFTGIYILRIADGKIVARWDEVNRFEVLQQLGALPAGGGR